MIMMIVNTHKMPGGILSIFCSDDCMWQDSYHKSCFIDEETEVQVCSESRGSQMKQELKQIPAGWLSREGLSVPRWYT